MNLLLRYLSFSLYLCISGVLLLSLTQAVASESNYPIAGTQPDSRPADAPVDKPITKTGDWYTQAVTGVEEPYPASLQFLENQGKWYTPFSKPGMTGPYDLRNWHKEE